MALDNKNKKRKKGFHERKSSNKINDPRISTILKKTVPLYLTHSYEEQLKLKEKTVRDMIQNAIKTICTSGVNTGYGIPDWIDRMNLIHEGLNNLECDESIIGNSNGKNDNNHSLIIRKILPSPITEGYRNKCEFTFGFKTRHQRDEDACVGFVLRRDGDDVIVSDDSDNLTECVEPLLVNDLEEETRVYDSADDKKVVQQYQPSLNFGWLPHLPLIFSELRCSLQRLMERNVTSLRPFSRRNCIGCWRLCVTRTSNSNLQLIAVIVVHTITDLVVKAVHEWVEIERKCGESLFNGRDIGIFLHEHQGLSDAPRLLDDNLLHICGPSSLEIELQFPCLFQSLKFRLRPQSFFQVNYQGCQTLYLYIANLIYSLVKRDFEQGHLILLDLYCGAGSIGISVASYIKEQLRELNISVHLIGVDEIQGAIDDAIVNAQNNSIITAKYYCSKVESCIQELLSSSLQINNYDLLALESENGSVSNVSKRRHSNFSNCSEKSDTLIVAIVDPPRCGLVPKVVRSVRNCVLIDYLIYVSCNHVTMERDIESFCSNDRPSPINFRTILKMGRVAKSKVKSEVEKMEVYSKLHDDEKNDCKTFDIATNYRDLITNLIEEGIEHIPPLVPIEVQAVDMFPHTMHCESVVTFQRTQWECKIGITRKV